MLYIKIILFYSDVDGIKLFAFHAKINEPLNGREGGTFSRDITRARDGRWTFYDRSNAPQWIQSLSLNYRIYKLDTFKLIIALYTVSILLITCFSLSISVSIIVAIHKEIFILLDVINLSTDDICTGCKQSICLNYFYIIIWILLFGSDYIFFILHKGDSQKLNPQT